MFKVMDFGRIERIAMEYHDCLDEVSDALRTAGFGIRVIPMKLYKRGNAGLIYAKKEKAMKRPESIRGK